ncbi:MAG: 50S ribosomal protein L4 [Caldisericaceae bacterium]
MKANIINVSDNSIEVVDLIDDYFGHEIKKHLVFNAVRRYLANKRRGTADTKERGGVKYSTIKLRPQKGSGRSRQGSRTSNIWKGGAVVFGPHPRDFSIKMNKKEIRQSVLSSLSARFGDGDVYFASGVNISGKTKEIVDVINRVKENLIDKVRDTTRNKFNSVLFVYSEENGNVEQAARNISYCKPLNYKFLNAYDLVNFDFVIMTKEAVDGLEGWWKNE